MNFITVMSKQARKSIDEVSLSRNLLIYVEDGSLLYRVNNRATGVMGDVFFGVQNSSDAIDIPLFIFILTG